MAGIFLVINRNSFEGDEVKVRNDLSIIQSNLLPIGSKLNNSIINIDNNSCLLVSVIDSKIKVHGFSICTGSINDLDNEWWTLSHVPAYASFLATVNDTKVVLSSNSTASRSIWYYFDDNQLIVSSSQRAIVTWIGSFESNPQAISWMLATGNLGPNNSWDKRIKHVGAGEVIEVNRTQWNLKSFVRESNLHEVKKLSNNQYIELLNETLKSVFSKASFNLDDSILTLSGGYDSRAVLYYLTKSGVNIKTVTWGLSSAVKDELTDSIIASKIASKLNVSNEYFVTDFKDKSFDPLFNRFLHYGEGRLDHINSFMDGFRMWENLYERGYRNIVRADEAFGWLPSRSEQDVRISLDLHLMEDNANMLPLQNFDLEPQQYPDFCKKLDFESIEEWRDRLYRQFRIPYVLSSLHDLIHPFVEVYNPLLHEDIVSFSKLLPDSLRTNKKIYAKFVSGLIPDVPFAKKSSIPEPAAILRSARIVSMMLDELNSQDSRNLINGKLSSWIQAHLTVDDNQINAIKDNWLIWFKQHIPWRVKKMLRKDFIKYAADFNQLAFRSVIITRMNRTLKSNADLISRNSK